MDYAPPFGFAAGACACALGGEVAADLVGAGTFTLKIGKFALSLPTVSPTKYGRVVGFFGVSAITSFLMRGLRLLAHRLCRWGLGMSFR